MTPTDSAAFDPEMLVRGPSEKVAAKARAEALRKWIREHKADDPMGGMEHGKARIPDATLTVRG